MNEHIVGWVLDNFIPSLLAGLAVALLASLLSKRVRNFFKNSWKYARNKEAHLDIVRIDVWGPDALRELDLGPQFYNQLKESTSAHISEPKYSENKISIAVSGLPTRMEIRLEEDLRFEGEESFVEGYKLSTSTDGELWIGYHTTDSLEKFENISNDVTNTVRERCFSSRPERSYTMVRVTYGAPYGVKTGRTERYNGVEIGKQNGELRFTFDDPMYLTKGIESYLKPFKRSLS